MIIKGTISLLWDEPFNWQLGKVYHAAGEVYTASQCMSSITVYEQHHSV